jgi:F-type H+-transporting ATPase subunit delta
VAGRPTPRRYAQAAFELALEHDAVDQWSEDLQLISDAIEKADFFALLTAPQVPERIKYQGVDTVLAGAGQHARNLIFVLVDHRSVHFFPAIREQFHALVDAHEGIARAGVTTAVPLMENQRSRVEELLSGLVGSKVAMTEKVDEDIIGGVIARVGDHLIDGSVRTRLDGLREAVAAPHGGQSDQG